MFARNTIRAAAVLSTAALSACAPERSSEGLSPPPAARSSLILQYVPEIHDLGTLGGADAQVLGQSTDGKVVVGWSTVRDSEIRHLFRWTERTGMTDQGEFSVETLTKLLAEAPAPKRMAELSPKATKLCERRGYENPEFLRDRTPAAGTATRQGHQRAVMLRVTTQSLD